MYTPEDIEKLASDILKASNLSISGDIVDGESRNTGSDEDITVKTLSLGDGDTQLGTVNVSFYCKDIADEGNENVNYKPNNEKLNLVIKEISTAFNGNYGVYGKWGNFFIESFSPLYRNEKVSEHFKVVRLRFRMKSLNDNPNYN